MTITKINNSDDIIDSRDVIARIAELETELTDAHEGEGNTVTFESWLEAAEWDDAHTMQDAAREYIALKTLAKEAEGYAADWVHGEALIRDTYFQEYAQELAADIGAINKDQTWPNNCIDWEEAAHQLQQDYTQVSFDGVDYWIS
jgi:hypothetical protein